MKQALIYKGKVVKSTVPDPVLGDKQVKIRVKSSCISPGTETANVHASGQSLLQKGWAQPQRFIKALHVLRQDGVTALKDKLSTVQQDLQATGYSLAGDVIEVGAQCQEFKVGDAVTAAGALYASHAEEIVAPENLVCHKPQDVSYEEASTVTLGAIALQALRRADLKLGEYALVFGSGLLGLLAIQLLCQSGVRVVALDLDEARLAQAKAAGAEQVFHVSDKNWLDDVKRFTGGFGVDAVLLCVNSASNDPISQSFHACKKKGKVVLVGVCGLDIKRSDLYEKELDFIMSTSYGPGRYDKHYEEEGHDYPYAYVRWTEKRNMQAYLQLLSRKAISLDIFQAEYLPFNNCEQAFAKLQSKETQKPLMIILQYPESQKSPVKTLSLTPPLPSEDCISVGFIGAGNFAQAVHLPNLGRLKQRFRVQHLSCQTPFKAKKAAQRFAVPRCSSDPYAVIEDESVSLIFICSPHHNHAELTLAALKAGKDVFVEKPLATCAEDLEKIKAFYAEESEAKKPLLMVGFNRRFSPYIQHIRALSDKRQNPLTLSYHVNAGYLPADHWCHEHGGRLVGECCHMLDTLSSLVQSPIQEYSFHRLRPQQRYYSGADNQLLSLSYEDGSIASIHYFSTGHPKLAKERLSLHWDQHSVILDNFQRLEIDAQPYPKLRHKDPQKGHLEQLHVLADYLQGQRKEWPIPAWDLFQTTEVFLRP